MIEIQSDVTATISGLTITDGFAEVAGGGIRTGEGASLTVDRVRITGNVAGQRVRTIYTGRLLPNREYPFTIDASSLASGLYLYRVSGEIFSESRRVLLLK